MPNYQIDMKAIFNTLCRIIALTAFLFIALISSQNVLAQKASGSLSGRILNEDGSPAYVTIELKKSSRDRRWDRDGLDNERVLTSRIRRHHPARSSG